MNCRKCKTEMITNYKTKWRDAFWEKSYCYKCTHYCSTCKKVYSYLEDTISPKELFEFLNEKVIHEDQISIFDNIKK